MSDTTIELKPANATVIENGSQRGQLAWLLLGLFYLFFGFIYSVINPLGALPDERANMQYVAFISQNGRMPIWVPSGNGEGGYEAQHPPLS